MNFVLHETEPLFSSFMIYRWIVSNSNTTDATIGAAAAFLFEAHEFSSGVLWGRVA
jgi:hypothetical protein